MTPDPHAIFAALDATWPAQGFHRHDPWLIRAGAGGGKRVSAATATAAAARDEIEAMEAMHARLGQEPLVMIRGAGFDTDSGLDTALDRRGYARVDPVLAYIAPIADLTGGLPALAAFSIWPPLGVQADIWAAGGIDAARLAVMARAEGAKTTLLARSKDRPAGAAFVAAHNDIAMIHAIEVSVPLRRQGAAAHMMRAAANWAQDQGARWLALMVTEANTGARALYESLGMTIASRYHYRLGPEPGRQSRGN